MELQDLLLFIEQYGYFALFFSLWLGIIGMPLPDEMIVMSGGFLSSLEKMVVWKSFLLTYLGVVSGLSLGFVLGKLFGHRVLDKLVKKKKAKYLLKSKELLDQYGRFALVLSYFIPIVRHILPYLVGMNNMSFKTYALFSYTTGFVWTLIYFTLGLLFGSQIEYISVIATKYGIYFGVFILIVSCFYYFYIRKIKK
ncbi:DedA family protein [Lysinibacillus fusiformis]|jgi:membrane protein DedA with SNARE-associated domain|uniref:DedA family protein n=1 Tax=Lysinibacillus TaxID=400634 RepID=UPI001967AD84|nr:DedA family protein [Lysinibacillus fusiformis]QSB08496.1 DedA family protein [Lysinibacillus fusiformis]